MSTTPEIDHLRQRVAELIRAERQPGIGPLTVGLSLDSARALLVEVDMLEAAVSGSDAYVVAALATLAGRQDTTIESMAAYLRTLWEHGPEYVRLVDGQLRLTTCGASYNEMLIGIIEGTLFYSRYWRSSERGGTHVFEPMVKVG